MKKIVYFSCFLFVAVIFLSAIHSTEARMKEKRVVTEETYFRPSVTEKVTIKKPDRAILSRDRQKLNKFLEAYKTSFEHAPSDYSQHFLAKARERWSDEQIFCALTKKPGDCRINREDKVAIRLMYHMGEAIRKQSGKVVIDRQALDARLSSFLVGLGKKVPTARMPKEQPYRETRNLVDPAKIVAALGKMDSIISIERPNLDAIASQRITDPDFYVELALPIDPDTGLHPQPYPFRLGGEFMSGFLLFNPFLVATSHPVKFDRTKVQVIAGSGPGSTSMTVDIQATGVVNGFQAGIAVRKGVAVPINAAETPVITIPIRMHEGMNPNPDVDTYAHLPPLCPRLTWDESESRFLYDAQQDPFLYPYPIFQNQQPDFEDSTNYPGQQEIQQHFADANGCDVLTIDKVETKFDYEDALIYISHKGDFTLTEYITEVATIDGTMVPFEAGGGTASNFYFVVLPCHSQYAQSFLGGINYEPNWRDYSEAPAPILPMLQIQPMQHILQGELDSAGAIDQYSYSQVDNNYFHRPSHRVQSFLPAMFQGETADEDLLDENNDGEGDLFTKCEFMDTYTQAPYQRVDYKNLAIWPWSMPINSQEGEVSECVVVAFYEGDHDGYWSTLNFLADSNGDEPDNPLVPGAEHFISDDLIAVFQVTKDELRSGPVVKKNHRHLPLIYDIPNTDGDPSWDFAVTFSTGNLNPACLVQQLPELNGSRFRELIRR